MLVYYIRGCLTNLPKGIAPKDTVCCESIGALLEHLRTQCGSEPFLLLAGREFDEASLRHIRYCFPDGFLVNADTVTDEQIAMLYGLVVCLRPSFSFRADRVRFIESDARKLCFHFPEYTRTFNYPMKKLPDLSDYGFLRCHGSFLVNIRFISSAHPDAFLMEGGESVPISRKYFSAYKAYVNQTKKQASPKLKKR